MERMTIQNRLYFCLSLCFVVSYHISYAQYQCEAGVEYGGSCYHYNSPPASWADAEIACNGFTGGHLAAVHSQDIFDFIQNIISPPRKTWIGLKKKSNVNAWVTGENSVYNNWESGEPDRSGDCIRSRDNEFEWGDSSCSSTYDYICEKEAVGGSCPYNWHSYQSSCYITSDTLGRSDKSWENARLDCANYGAHLVTITSAGENSVVANLRSSSHWYGMKAGLYFWNGNGTYADSYAEWLNWDSTPSTNLAESSSCVFSDPPRQFRWRTDSCTKSYEFLCESQLVDIDECAQGTHNCHQDANCTNTDGSFGCNCNPGYSGDGVTCADDDECTLNTHNCDINAVCNNAVGSFLCACDSGYLGNGTHCEVMIPTRKRGLDSQVYKGQRLTNHILDMARSRSRIDCARLCNTKRDCVAFNFKKKGLDNNCQLLSRKMDDSPPTDLIIDSDWNYYEVQMRVWE
ncbi:unnamed protein product [Owenia fusiformis]|uniref:Uncharacterized protein n=1 Tax=Owenia fusiformis TaxID=6347 RepID=A0A8J1XIX7_OWEFU|nr:unnamed protein product [Owenia fusiformis]